MIEEVPLEEVTWEQLACRTIETQRRELDTLRAEVARLKERERSLLDAANHARMAFAGYVSFLSAVDKLDACLGAMKEVS